MSYPKAGAAATDGVPAQPSFPVLEEAVLSYWSADHTFQASIDNRPAGVNGSNEFVFYDGPPFANGLPHYGHLLTGYVKDVVPRYQTMLGRHVERRFGWDTHGMPAEIETEHQLGIKVKAEIEALGIAEFNDACRASVLRYTQEWREYVTRQARWVDFDNDYKTLDLDYMESVMWAFRTLWDKGLIYQGFRVLPYCWRCETPLANTELRMDADTYRERQDPASTVWFELETGERVLAWTTMPWTLIPNLAMVVGDDIDYAVMELDGHRYILAEARLGAYERELAGAVRVGSMKGSELVGRKYKPLFDYLVDQTEGTRAFTILSGDFVTTEDGTGVVQVSPCHGEDDFNVCTAAGIPPILTVDAHARFLPMIPEYEGLQVFDANRPLLRSLRERGVLFREDSYLHPYPHCWRCDNPLVYKAVSSWFVAVTTFRDRMVELNQQINWVPEHVRDGQFGKWLEGARDWSISRNRFWGSPVPVWMSDDPNYPRTDVYGSLEELERDFGVRLTDLHRPHVDNLTRPNPDDPTGRSTMRRVPEVLDCWFDSGSMPFAQVHYPMANADWFEHHYPGDFIVEYTAQSRGWFYLMHVLATALFDRPAFRNCIAHGIVLGDDGLKMSKSSKNYPDVNQVFDRDGSDAMRWFLMSSPVLRGGNLVVTERGIRDAVRQAVLPLWNSWYFLALYANAAGREGTWRTDSEHVLDRYVLAKTHDLVTSVRAALDAYDLSGACATVREFLEVLTNWYVRRSRDRFWAGDVDAVDTLHTVLEVACRTMAPLLPLTTEEVWRGLTGERSVHLTDWPAAAALPADDALVTAMDEVRRVCSAALSLRKASKLRVRLPLARLVVAAPDADALAPFAGIIADEVNVKRVELTTDVAAHGHFELVVNARACGPRLGGDTQKVIRAVKAGEWTTTGDGAVVAAGIELLGGEYERRLVATDPGLTAALPGGAGLVVLDTDVTPELAAEGVARDVIRAVQQARREADFEVSDRITVTVAGDAAVLAAVRTHEEFLKSETLATSVTYGDLDHPGFQASVGDGLAVEVAVRRI
ncbi:MAG TPA: isoleucine--tRNA ligase [Pseudonocardiaceae bacterium]|jgi:isoleucyl-tRNA synthetase|nr:isoleucine--tRNA ligase [Pseudonocardiaceae bacterium]